MPDFNFAKGSGKRDPRSSPPTGGAAVPPRNHPAQGATATGPAGPAAASSSTGGETTGQPPRRSVLEKYPERDLSHLTSEGGTDTDPVDVPSPAPPARTDAPPASDGGEANAPGDDDAPANETRSSDTDDAPAPAAKGNSSGPSAPLIAFLVIAGLLVIVAFIWYVNPWPPLRDALAGFFSSGRNPESAIVAPRPAAEEAPAPALRSWDYFLQVSSWKELSKADLDAERFRAQGFDVIVESEYIAAKGGTWYRVRLGPYESADAARGIVTANANLLPKGVYVDSVRLVDETPLEELPPIGQTGDGATPASTQAGGGDAPARQRTASPATGTRIPGRDFEVIDEPMSGWAVKVSSLKDVTIARSEARRLLQQGYPSFITKKILGGATWYRVLVGPFNQKSDADRYQQLLNVTYGNDAYTVDLAAE